MSVPVSYAVPHEKTSPIFARAFAQGCGGMVTRDDRLLPGSVALFGSPHRWALLTRARELGRTWYYGDHAYMGRQRYFRITRNAFQHDGRGDATPDRFLALGRRVQPWRTSGTHVLLCPNSATYFGLFGHEAETWVNQCIDQLARWTDRPVRVRWKGSETPIERDLVDCWAVVVYSSASAIDALIAGVPVFTLAPFAATVRMGQIALGFIETPFYPDDRESFLWNLADNQWTLEEIRAGVAWRALSAQPVAA